MKAVFKKELRALLGGFRGWGYVAITLLGAGIAVFMVNLLGLSTRFEMSAYYIAIAMIPATVAATTDAFQAERRQNTERMLYSLPLKNSDIVLGKLFALTVPVLIAAACLCVFPLMLAPYGTLYWGPALASILALAVLGTVMMAIGLCMSACSCNRFVAALTTAAVLAASWAVPYAAEMIALVGTINLMMMVSFMLVGFTVTYLLSNSALAGIIAAAIIEVPMLLAYLQGTGAAFMQSVASGINALNIFDGLNPFVNGLLDGSVLIGWLAVAALFAFITILFVGNRRQAKRRAL